MQEKKSQQPTQNIQMMRSEPGKDGSSVNIVTRSCISTGEDKTAWKQPKENIWVRKVVKKDVGFDLQKET